MSMYKVIARFCHVMNPGKPKGTDKLRWSIQGLIHKQDPQAQTLSAEIETAKKNGFPSGFPAKADVCLIDCAVEYPSLTVLHDYYALNANTPTEVQGKPMSQPVFMNKFNQKITEMRADVDVTGHYAYVDVGIASYQLGSGGVKAYLNGVMDTGEIGPIPVESLSSTPTGETMFAGVATSPPEAGMFAGVNAPPAAPAAPVRTMTPKAAGATYETFVANGWTDAMLIEQGYMMPGF